MKRLFLLLILMIIFSYAGAIAQTLTLSPYGVSPRDVARDTTDHYFDRAYNGILNVGKETKMYFKVFIADSVLTNPVWSIDEKPAGSNAAFGSTKNVDESTQLISFIPDLVGTYKISVTDGALTGSLTINSALYLGVNSTAPNCINCHNSSLSVYKFYDNWAETNHASLLERGLNGTASDHYGPNCISCHTVGYDVNANNNGFDDFDFVFPDSLYPGVYDLTVAAYPDAMQRANIQCESCHGPGSGHNALIDDSRISKSLSTDNCAWCHDSGTHHAFPEQWDHSGDDATEFDGRGFDGGHAKGTFVGSAGGRAGCSMCHSGSGFVAWAKNGKVEAEIIPPPTLITCATCHDPHDATNPYQLRILDVELGDGTQVSYDQFGTGVLCMNCHKSRRDAKTYAEDPDNASSHYGAHHGPEADLLLGVNAPNFGIDLPSSPHAQASENACVDCHMYGNNQVADAEGNIILVGGHSFNMNDAEGHDNVAACAPCHGNFGSSFKDKKYYVNGVADLDGNGIEEGLQIEVHGLMGQLANLLPQNEDGEVELTPGDSTLTPAIMRAAYVYFWIEEDRSFGIHNPAFTFGLLKASIEGLGGVVSVEFPKGEGMPQGYQLSQNYPNPFNPTTTIEYSVPELSTVTITIYDAIGNEIEQVLSGEKAPGTYSVQWNASNYASGIYFYKLSTEKFIQVKKMLLLK